MAKDETDIGANVDVCKNCGEPLEPGIKFCIKCGTPINGTPETAIEPELQSEADELLKQDEPMAAQPVPEQEQIEPPPAEPVLAPPQQEPVYQAESYSPTSDIPFPDVPEAPPEAVLQRQQPRQTGIFVSGILGFVVMIVLLIGAFAAGLLNSDFLGTMNLNFLYLSLLQYGSIACAVVLTSRAKGPDLSIGAVMTLAAFLTVSTTGSWILAIVLAVLVCTAIGAINGLFIVYLRVPALIMTIVVSAILRGIFYMMGRGSEITAVPQIRMMFEARVGGLPIIYIAVFGIAFILAFLLIILSKLGKPLSKREASDNKRVSYFLAYLFSSVIACFVGIMFLSRVGMASPVMGMNLEVFIILIFAAITSSRFLDNRVVPVLYAAVAVVLYVLLINILSIYHLNQFIIQIALAAVTLGFVAISYIARKDIFKGLVERL